MTDRTPIGREAVKPARSHAVREVDHATPLRHASAITIATVLTDNGQEFTDRLFALHERQPGAGVRSTRFASCSMSSTASREH